MTVGRIQRILLMAVLISGQFACTTLQAPGSADLSLLPAGSEESSGLICTAQGFLTVNDSGNPAELQQLDTQLRLSRIALPLDNTDWEAITTDGQLIYIADTGNNSGQRAELQIHRVRYQQDSTDLTVLPGIRLRYAGYPEKPPAAYQHDFDAEALAYAEGSLWLFSKSWQSGISQVYQIDPDKIGPHTFTATAHIAGLPGLVTDAVYLPEHQRFVLTGYQNYLHQLFRFALEGQYDAFAAITDRQFRLLQVIPLPHAGQLEGICARGSEIWLSQEQSEQQAARLWREPLIEAALKSAQQH